MKKKQRKKRHEQEELTLSKALVIADKHTMLCIRMGIPHVHSQASEIMDKII